MTDAAQNSGQNGQTEAPQYARPASIEDWSNRAIVHPISAVFANLAIKLKISANMVSFAGLFAGWIAAYFYFYMDRPLYVFGGLGFMVLWHVLDGADGRVARATGTSSAFGRIIDGICDHLVFGAVYIAILVYMSLNGAPAWVWAAGIGAGLSHAVQAAGYEERRQKYQRRTRGLARAQINDKLKDIGGKQSGLAAAYDKIQKLVSGGQSALDTTLENMRAQGLSENTVQTLINKTALIVRSWSLLNANNRTIMIFIFCALGLPLWYFIYEIIVLNAVLLLNIGFEKRYESKLAAQGEGLLKAHSALTGQKGGPRK